MWMICDKINLLNHDLPGYKFCRLQFSYACSYISGIIDKIPVMASWHFQFALECFEICTNISI